MVRQPSLFTAGDIGSFFGLCGDVFSKIAVIVTVLLINERMPQEIVLGRILPGIAVGSIAGSLLYAYEGFRLGRYGNSGRITALPFGVGSTQVFGWLFIIIVPIYRQTGNAELAWSAGLAACCIGSFVELAGVCLTRWIERYIPLPALIANMAAAAFIWLSFNGSVSVFSNPPIAVLSLLIAVITVFRRVPIIPGIPNAVLITVIGSTAAWLTRTTGMQQVQEAVQYAGFYPPQLHHAAIVYGIRHIVPYLPVIIPLQIANVLTTVQAVESAALAGDRYPLKRTLVIDGSTTLISALFGSPFPTTVYFGHAGWKRQHAGCGYILLMIIPYTLLFFGLPSLITAVIPFEVIIVFVITAGLAVTADVHNKLKKDQSIAVYLSLIPIAAQYIITVTDNLLHQLNSASDIYAENKTLSGLLSLSYGAFASSLLYSIWIMYIQQKKYRAAGLTCAVLAGLSAVGFIHYPVFSLLPRETGGFVASYLVLGLVCMLLAAADRVPHSDEAA